MPQFKISPKNYLADWGEFESWAKGAGSAPDGWIIASTPIIAQESTLFKFGFLSAKVCGTNGVGGLYRTIPNGSDYAGRTFKLGVWGRSLSTGPYIELNDGVTSKTVHLDGSNAFVFMTTPAMKLAYTATQIRINLFASLAATAYFDSAVLCEGEDLFTEFEAVSDWQPSLNMKQDQYDPPSEDGSIIPDSRLQSRNLRLRGTVAGADIDTTVSSFDTLTKSLKSWKTNEKRDLYFNDNRVFEVFLKSFEWAYKNSLKFIEYNAQFSIPKATARTISKYRTRSVIAGTVTEFSIAYEGTEESSPVISFIADQGVAITTCILENLTTQENIIITGTVPSGAAFDIDCDAGTVFNSSINALSQFGTSDFMRLVRGTNYFRFSGSNCTINIDNYDRYL